MTLLVFILVIRHFLIAAMVILESGNSCLFGKKIKAASGVEIKKRGVISHRYNLLPLLHFCPGGVRRELVV